MNEEIIFDLEATETGVFAGFKHTKDGEVTIDLTNQKELINYIRKYKDDMYIGFNNINYDNVLLNYCLANKNLTKEQVLNYSNLIISGKVKPAYNIMLGRTKINTFDVFASISKKMSLKLRSFVDYKYIFKEMLTASDIGSLENYNKEDIMMTELIYKDKCIDDYKISLYLSEYLKINSTSNNLTISIFLLNKAKYNPNFDFKNCLDKLNFIDDDLKSIALELLADDEVLELYTQDKFLVKKGGLHYPIDTDFTKKGVRFFDIAYNYDYSSYYPNIYIYLLDFFDTETKMLLENILKDRLEAKTQNDTTKNTALKLFINSIYGQLAKINQPYMYSVALLGQIMLIQMIRDNNISLDSIIEINTDGILLKNRYENLVNKTNIELEETILTNIYHKNSNTKSYFINNKFVSKGKLFENYDYTDKLTIFDLSPIVKNNSGTKIYNCFIVKHKIKDGLPLIKYYKFNDLSDISKYNLKDNCCLMNKLELTEAIETNILVEINEFNQKEDITSIIKNLFDTYLNELGDYILLSEDNNFSLENNELNQVYQDFKDLFYMIPSNKKEYYKGISGEIKHPTKSIHNMLMFNQKSNPKTIGILCDYEFIAVDVDDASLVPDDIIKILDNSSAIKIITINKKGEQVDLNKFKYIFKQPLEQGITLNKITGLEYLKGLKKCNIAGMKEAGKYYKAINNKYISKLPNCFYTNSLIKKSTYSVEPNHINKYQLDYSQEKLDILNKKTTNLNFRQEKNNNYIKLVSKCLNHHQGGNKNSLMIAMNQNYFTISCFASGCEFNDKTSEKYKLLQKVIYDIFYIKNNNQNSDIIDITIEETNSSISNIAPFNFDITSFNTPPEQPFIYKINNHYLPENIVGLITSRGGLGKSYFVLNLISQLVVNKPMLINNLEVQDDLNILYYSLEDRQPIIHDRLLNISKLYKLDNIDISTLLSRIHFIFDLNNQRLTLENTILQNQIINHIKSTKSKLIIIDTLARICDLDAEIDNIKATQFIQVLEKISKETSSTILLLHHTNKQSISEDSILANARGSSALIDSCRYVLTLKDFIQQKSGYKNLKEQSKIKDLYSKYDITNIIELATAKSNYSVGLNKYLVIDKKFKLKEVEDKFINDFLSELTKKDTIQNNNDNIQL